MTSRPRMPSRPSGHASRGASVRRAPKPAPAADSGRRGRAAGSQAKAPRTRRSATEARLRILEAAQRELLRVGPEALRLTDLARQLQVSHPAILHHFGSRAGLVAAVVRHSMEGLTQQLIAALDAAAVKRIERIELVEMVAEVCRDGGLARLLAFLLLSDRESKDQSGGRLPIKRLAEAAHDLRQRLGHPASYEDTLFEVQLLAIVLLGDAIFGDAVRRASGFGDDDAEAAMRDFRRRLVKLLPP